MEIFATVFSGVCVYILGQIILELYIKPYRKYKKLKALIVEKVGYYANIYGITNSENCEISLNNNYRKASNELRGIGQMVCGFIEIMPYIHFNIPNKHDLYEVSRCLIFLSNSINSNSISDFKDIREAENKIYTLLKSYQKK